jgi:hypothetical protein
MVNECGDVGVMKIMRGEPEAVVEIPPQYRFIYHKSHTA